MQEKLDLSSSKEILRSRPPYDGVQDIRSHLLKPRMPDPRWSQVLPLQPVNLLKNAQATPRLQRISTRVFKCIKTKIYRFPLNFAHLLRLFRLGHGRPRFKDLANATSWDRVTQSKSSQDDTNSISDEFTDLPIPGSTCLPLDLSLPSQAHLVKTLPR